MEMSTAAQNGIGVVAVVFSDGAYGNVKRIQQQAFNNRTIASDLHNPDFVKLAEIAGASRLRVIRRHILPNVLNTATVLASLTVGVVIIAEASLSFLGVGVPPPQPTITATTSISTP